MIDYYYEFPEGTKLLEQTTRYALLRGYHPEEASTSQNLFHSQCYFNATRVWLENSNGASLVRKGGRDVHEKVHPKEITWIKLQARELEVI